MLSTKNSTSWPWSRKSSAMVRPVRATRARAPGRLVHLAVDERGLGAFAAAFLVDAGLDEFVIEVVALAGALANAGEHGVAAMRLGDVVDQFLDQNGLADAGAAEQADLAALGVGRQQVDDLDAGDEDLGFGRLVDIGRRFLVDAAQRLGLTGPASSTGSPTTLMMRPSISGPTGTVIGPPVSTTVWPRTRPSVESIAMQRTVFSPRCCATSRTRRWPLLSVSSAFRICGRWSVNCTSTTAPITCATLPSGPLANFTAAGFFAAALAIVLPFLRALPRQK
jgi:hypothetical protein